MSEKNGFSEEVVIGKLGCLKKTNGLAVLPSGWTSHLGGLIIQVDRQSGWIGVPSGAYSPPTPKIGDGKDIVVDPCFCSLNAGRSGASRTFLRAGAACTSHRNWRADRRPAVLYLPRGGLQGCQIRKGYQIWTSSPKHPSENKPKREQGVRQSKPAPSARTCRQEGGGAEPPLKVGTGYQAPQKMNNKQIRARALRRVLFALPGEYHGLRVEEAWCPLKPSELRLRRGV